MVGVRLACVSARSRAGETALDKVSVLVWYSYRIRRGSAVVCALVGMRLACVSARSRTGETTLDKATP